MTSQPRAPLTGVPCLPSAGDPSAPIPADEPGLDETPSRADEHYRGQRDPAAGLHGSHLLESPFAFDLVVALLCVAVLSWAAVVWSPRQPAAPGSAGLPHLSRHRAPSLEPGERRSSDDASSNDDGDVHD